MKNLVIAAVVLLLGLPALAQQQPHRGECMKLTRQIARYERDAGWAKERENALWEQASQSQVQNLSTRREKLCPQFAKPNPWEGVGELIGKAARLAAKYFVGGL